MGEGFSNQDPALGVAKVLLYPAKDRNGKRLDIPT
jgi:hypothetical protein